MIASTAPDLGTKRQPLTIEQRWFRAAQKAIANDLHHRLRRRGSTVLVPSKTTDTIYHVRLDGEHVGPCDCPASLSGNSICAHRFAVAARVWERRHGLIITQVRPKAVSELGRYLRDM